MVKEWLLDFLLLTDTNPHRAADPAFAASYSLTGLHGENGPVRVEVDEIEVSLFLVFSHDEDLIDAPFGDLPLDRLSVGAIVPSLHVDFQVSDFDIDIEIPRIGGGHDLISLLAIVAEWGPGAGCCAGQWRGVVVGLAAFEEVRHVRVGAGCQGH